MTNPRTQRVVFQPATGAALQRGIRTIVAAVRPTLGPRPRLVAVQRAGRTDGPEMLDDAGLIARRIIQLPNRDEDMGAMLVRQMLWQVRERAGDGSAAAAVIFESIYNQGLAYITAGGDAMRLRRDLETGLRGIVDRLAGMTQPLRGRRALEHFAHSVCHDLELAQMLGEVFDIVGEYGRLDIRSGQGRNIEREYVEGMYWDAAPYSRAMLTGKAQQRVELEDAAILVSDLNVARGEELVPLLEAMALAGERRLLLICQSLAPQALGLLMANSQADHRQIVAVHTPYVGNQQKATLEDLALLTGAQVLLQAAGDSMAAARHLHLGHARRAWADKDFFGIVGGRGDPKRLRAHLAELRAAVATAADLDVRKKQRERIGRLMAGSATLWIGGATEAKIKLRTELAERTAEALRGALMEGVVPGGGAALLDCRPLLRQMADEASDWETRTAYRILSTALETPARTLIANAGCDVARAMGEVDRAGPGHGFEVHGERVAPMIRAGILDAASVVRFATIAAVTAAALALTTDVLVHRAKPVMSSGP